MLAASILSRFATAGWVIFILAVPYMLVLTLHVAVRWVVMASPLFARSTRRLLVASVVSDVLLLIGFLLQWDFDDDRGWLAITALVNGSTGAQEAAPPAWWPAALGLPGVVFGPLVVSWWYLLTSSGQEIKRRSDDVSPTRRDSLVVGLLIGLALLLAAIGMTQLAAGQYQPAHR